MIQDLGFYNSGVCHQFVGRLICRFTNHESFGCGLILPINKLQSNRKEEKERERKKTHKKNRKQKLSIALVQAGHKVKLSSQSQLHQLTAADLKAGPHQLTAQLILLYASNWQTSNGAPYLSCSSLPTFAASSASCFTTHLHPSSSFHSVSD